MDDFLIFTLRLQVNLESFSSKELDNAKWVYHSGWPPRKKAIGSIENKNDIFINYWVT